MPENERAANAALVKERDDLKAELGIATREYYEKVQWYGRRTADTLAEVDVLRADLAAKDAAIATLEAELKAIGRDTLPCLLCKLPVVFEFTVASPIWNRVVRAKGIDEYLCFWCFDELAAGEQIPVGVNLNGKTVISVWCGDDVPGAYPDEVTRQQLEAQAGCLKAQLTASEASERKLREALEHIAASVQCYGLSDGDTRVQMATIAKAALNPEPAAGERP